MAFIDALRSDGHAVESICRVLREQGCEVAARTYRSWKSPSRMVAARTVTDAVVVDALLATRGTPEGLYGRRKMVALLRRQGLPVAHCTVDRLMRDLGMNGVRRGRRVRTTVPDARASRPGDLLDRQFTAAEPNAVWVADFTYVRTWSGFAYVAFVVDCFAQRIVAWHAAMSRPADLVITPLRMAIWQRDHDGHAITPGQLIHHNDAGSQYTSIRFTEHLADAGIAPSIGTVGDAYDCAHGEPDRPVQNRGHRQPRLPRRAIQDTRRRRVHHHGLGRLVEQPPLARHPRHAHPRRVRNGALRCTQPRAAAHIGPAEEP